MMIDHVGLTVSDLAHSKRFYAAALAPLHYTLMGECPHHHPGYYGAFVLDPDGNNVEAVCHTAA